MVTYLYCILAPPNAEAFPSGLTGIGGTVVRTVVGEDLEAWVATVDETSFRATGSALVRLAIVHNEVVEAALATGRTPLPARFGTRFADEDALKVDLRKQRLHLVDRLHRVAGAVEMSVLVVPRNRDERQMATRPRRDEPAAGRRYLEAVRERTRNDEQRFAEANRVAQQVSKAVSEMTSEEVRSLSSNVLSIAHLVRRDDLDRYRLALSAVDSGEQFKIIVAGPRGPYSFVTENSSLTSQA